MVHGWLLLFALRARHCLSDGTPSARRERSQPLHPVWPSSLWITLPLWITRLAADDPQGRVLPLDLEARRRLAIHRLTHHVDNSLGGSGTDTELGGAG